MTAAKVAHVAWEAMRLIAEDAGQPFPTWEALDEAAREGLLAWVVRQEGRLLPLDAATLHRDYEETAGVPTLPMDAEPLRLLPRWRRRQFAVAAGILGAIGAD